MSAFTTVVGRLGELSESELRQLHSIVGIRLGLPEGGSQTRRAGGSTSNKGGGKSKGVKSPKGQGGAKKAASKGNPSRKSQWETHPLYREYKRLKKVVETQAKESNVSFAAVDTPEREAYNTALSQWLEAKSSFRGHRDAEEEGAEGTSAKGKEKAAEPAPEGDKPPTGSSSGNAGGSNWADEVQDAMDVERDSDSGEESDESSVQADVPNVDKGPKRGARTASLPSRGTPPKKSSGGSSRRKK